MKFLIAISSLLLILNLTACSNAEVKSGGNAIASLLYGTNNEIPTRKTFMDDTVKEALEKAFDRCVGKDIKNMERRAECVQIAYQKVKEDMNLEQQNDGTVIIKEVSDDQIINEESEEK